MVRMAEPPTVSDLSGPPIAKEASRTSVCTVSAPSEPVSVLSKSAAPVLSPKLPNEAALRLFTATFPGTPVPASTDPRSP